MATNNRLSIDQRLRILRGILIFWVMTVFWDLPITFIGGMLTKLLMIPPHLSPVTRQGQRWIQRVWHHCYANSLNQRCSLPDEGTKNSLEQFKRPGLTLLLCNHPHTYETFVPIYVASLFSDWLVVSAKSSHLLNPIGFGAWSINCVVLINRLYELKFLKRWPTLVDHLRRFSLWWMRRQLLWLRREALRSGRTVVLMVFPDQRWTWKRYQEYHAKFGKQLPDDGEWMQFALLPKDGLIMEVLQAVGDQISVVDMACAPHVRNEGGWTSLAPLVNMTHLVRLKDVTAELQKLAGSPDLRTLTRPQLRGWLNTVLWPRKVRRVIMPWQAGATWE